MSLSAVKFAEGHVVSEWFFWASAPGIPGGDSTHNVASGSLLFLCRRVQRISVLRRRDKLNPVGGGFPSVSAWTAPQPWGVSVVLTFKMAGQIAINRLAVLHGKLVFSGA
jgi:hypothetical protein